MVFLWVDNQNKIRPATGSSLGQRSKIQATEAIKAGQAVIQEQDDNAIPETTKYDSYTKRQSRAGPLIAKDIMSSPVKTLGANQSLQEAWNFIQTHRFRHVPVTSQEKKVVGIISDRDLLRAVSTLDKNQEWKPDTPISELMVTPVLSTTPFAEIRAIAHTLFENKVGAMPIVDETAEAIGIITRSDILRLFIKMLPFERWI